MSKAKNFDKELKKKASKTTFCTVFLLHVFFDRAGLHCFWCENYPQNNSVCTLTMVNNIAPKTA